MLVATKGFARQGHLPLLMKVPLYFGQSNVCYDREIRKTKAPPVAVESLRQVLVQVGTRYDKGIFDQLGLSGGFRLWYCRTMLSHQKHDQNPVQWVLLEEACFAELRWSIVHANEMSSWLCKYKTTNCSTLLYDEYRMGGTVCFIVTKNDRVCWLIASARHFLSQ